MMRMRNKIGHNLYIYIYTHTSLVKMQLGILQQQTNNKTHHGNKEKFKKKQK